MADRGVAVAHDATQVLYDAFEHVPRSVGVFAEARAEDVLESPFLTDVETWVHPGLADVTEEPVDWGAEHTKYVGDGWYMTEPVTGQIKLQGAPSGRAATAGALSLDLTLAGAAAGGSTTAAPLLKDVSLVGEVAGRGSIVGNLRNTKALEVATGGTAAASGNLRLLGAYATTVLADGPRFFARINEPSGSQLFNDPSLGGAEIGYLNGSYSRLPGLVETDSYSSSTGAIRANSGAYYISGNQGFAREYTWEMWLKAPKGSQAWQKLISWVYIAPGMSNGDVLLEVERDATGVTVRMNVAAGNGGQILLTHPNTLRDDKPHHLVFTYQREGEGGRLTYYLDGQVAGSGWAGLRLLPEAAFAEWGGMVMQDTVATVDAISYWPSPISAQQVSDHYDAAWFDPRFIAPAIGGSEVAGDLTMAFGLSGTTVGSTTMGQTENVAITFDSQTLPSGASFSHQPTFVTRTDSVAGTSIALRQADIVDREVAYTDIPLRWSGSTTDSLTVRYFIDSEDSYDYAYFYLDDVEFLSDSGRASSYRVATLAGIAPGDHVLRISYKKDGSDSAGIDNVDVSRITYWSNPGIDLTISRNPLVIQALAGSVTGIAEVMLPELVIFRAGISSTGVPHKSRTAFR